MISVVQRVEKGNVTVNNEEISSIGCGLVVLTALEKNDSEEDLSWMINKLLNLRIFSDEQGKFNLSVKDVKGELILVSQFTLAGNCKKGNRPSFDRAMDIETANKTFNMFVEKTKTSYSNVKTGIFQQHMKVGLINDGPVTIILDSKNRL